MSNYLFNPEDIPADWNERLEREITEKVENAFAAHRIFQWVENHVRYRILTSNPMLNSEDFSVRVEMEKGGVLNILIDILTKDGDKRNWLTNLGIPISINGQKVGNGL